MSLFSLKNINYTKPLLFRREKTHILNTTETFAFPDQRASQSSEVAEEEGKIKAQEDYFVTIHGIIKLDLGSFARRGIAFTFNLSQISKPMSPKLSS